MSLSPISRRASLDDPWPGAPQSVSTPLEDAPQSVPGWPLSGRLKILTQGFWAVTDQGLFAISNLLVNVLLARWLPPGEYGAFATAYAILLLFGVAHLGLLTEPMLIFGSGKYATCCRSYFRILLRYHWWLSGIAATALALIGGVLWLRHEPALAIAFAMLSGVAPFVFLSWLTRRACYLHSKPSWAAASGGLYLLLVAGGAVALYRFQLLSVVSGSLLIGVSALVAALSLMRLVSAPQGEKVEDLTPASVWADHWEYGRWATSTGLVAWVPLNMSYLLLPRWGGLEASAAFKALFNFIMPVLHSDGALTTLLVPTLVRARRNARRFKYLLQVVGSLLALEGAIYWLVLVVFRKQLVFGIYGEAYLQYANLLWGFGLIPIAGGLLNLLGSALRALERVEQVFWATILSGLVSATVGVAAVGFLGIAGSILGILLSWMAQIAAMIWFVSKRRPALS
jgi:O-antigen/teichoic acid export membrane protein